MLGCEENRSHSRYVLVQSRNHVTLRTRAAAGGNGYLVTRSTSQRQYMLHQTALSTKRTFGLFSCPVADTCPAEYMSACGHTRVLHLLQTQRALSISSPDPAHSLFVR
jgi:hypothetical protein